MWVQVSGTCAPALMVSSLETLKRAPNTPVIAASPQVIWFQSLRPLIGPSLISKVELPVFSLVVVVVDSHIQRIVLATEETSVT